MINYRRGFFFVFLGGFFFFFERIISENIALDSERCPPKTKQSFKKQENNFRKNKKRKDVISVLLYASELWTISSRNKNRHKERDMCFYRKILRIPWTEHVTNNEVLVEMETKVYLYLTPWRSNLNFYGTWGGKKAWDLYVSHNTLKPISIKENSA